MNYEKYNRLLNVAWLAGLIEGEGSIIKGRPLNRNKRPRFLFSMNSTDKDVLYKAQKIFGEGKIRSCKTIGLGTKPQWVWRIDHQKGVCRLINLIYPFLGQRRIARANEALVFFKLILPTNDFKKDKTKIPSSQKIQKYINEAWLAGLIEGEGSISHSTRRGLDRFTFYMQITDLDVIQRARDIFNSGTIRTRPITGISKKQSYVWGFEGHNDLYKLLKMIYPYLGRRRKERATEALKFLEQKKAIQC